MLLSCRQLGSQAVCPAVGRGLGPQTPGSHCPPPCPRSASTQRCWTLMPCKRLLQSHHILQHWQSLLLWTWCPQAQHQALLQAVLLCQQGAVQKHRQGRAQQPCKLRAVGVNQLMAQGCRGGRLVDSVEACTSQWVSNYEDVRILRAVVVRTLTHVPLINGVQKQGRSRQSMANRANCALFSLGHPGEQAGLDVGHQSWNEHVKDSSLACRYQKISMAALVTQKSMPGR